MYKQLAKLNEDQSLVVARALTIFTIVAVGFLSWFIVNDDYKTSSAILSLLWIPATVIGFFGGRYHSHEG